MSRCDSLVAAARYPSVVPRVAGADLGDAGVNRRISILGGRADAGTEGVMDTYRAFANLMVAQASGAKLRVFDWEKAARLIKEQKPSEASAGLSGDWEWTGGIIWRDGKPVPRENTYVYLASLWAEPELDMDGDIVGCWRYVDETPGWDEHTYWPAEVVAQVKARDGDE